VKFSDEDRAALLHQAILGKGIWEKGTWENGGPTAEAIKRFFDKMEKEAPSK
jgi:hypothetical protein